MTSNIVYRVATPKDQDLVSNFLREHFYPHEPLLNSFELDQKWEFGDDTMMKCLANEFGTTHLAMCDDQIVGTILAAPDSPEREPGLLEKASHVPGTKSAIMSEFLAILKRDASVYTKYKVDKALRSHAVAVHQKFRARGIGRRLRELSVERAKELGYPLYTCNCSNLYTSSVCERLGFDCVNEFAYADYRAPGSDKQIFFPREEHQHIKTFAKRL